MRRAPTKRLKPTGRSERWRSSGRLPLLGEAAIGLEAGRKPSTQALVASYDGLMANDRGPFLAWQWSRYGPAHQDRRNLLVHALTAPVYIAGGILVLLSPFLSLWLLPGGLLAMGLVMFLQGRAHGLEKVRPAPFLGPGDLVLRLLAEQWFTFPRYVLTGGFGRAWRAKAD